MFLEVVMQFTSLGYRALKGSPEVVEGFGSRMN